jgi:hypothetical protein
MVPAQAFEPGIPRRFERHIAQNSAEFENEPNRVAGAAEDEVCRPATYASSEGIDRDQPRAAHVIHSAKINKNGAMAFVQRRHARGNQLPRRGSPQPAAQREHQDTVLNVALDFERPYRFHRISPSDPL